MSVPAPVFELDAVHVRFPSAHALTDVSLTIHQGEAVAIVGPSGAGKTTLLRLLNGAVRPTAGHVAIEGRPLAALGAQELRQVRAGIGFIHQDLCLVPNVRVLHNVVAGRFGRLSLPASLLAALFPSRHLQREAYELLERVGIADKLHERTDRLSGGQRQRVAIARALFQQPSALLADEPISSVDPARARDTLELLTGISRHSGLTVCASLHNLELAREFFPRLVGLRGGRLLFDLPSSALTASRFDELYRLTRDGSDGGA